MIEIRGMFPRETSSTSRRHLGKLGTGFSTVSNILVVVSPLYLIEVCIQGLSSTFSYDEVRGCNCGMSLTFHERLSMRIYFAADA